jgi:PEP-CTERM motif
VTRQSNEDGIWFWNTTFTGPQALTYLIGQSLPPAPETSPSTSEPLALAYTLTGAKVATAVPEPPSWALLLSGFAVAGVLSARRRLSPSTARLTA